MINNQGDLAAVLAELGSESTLRSLVGSILTAGLSQGALDIAQVGAVTPGANFGQNFVNAAQTNLIKAAIKVGVSTTVEGQPLDQSLISALRLAAADTLGQAVATEIGNIGVLNGLNEGDFSKILLHAALGCTTGAVASNDCLAGAIGGGLQEVLGKPISELLEDPATQTQVIALLSGGAAALAGAGASGIGAAAHAASTAHTYNYLAHDEMLAKLRAEDALGECHAQASTCTGPQMDQLQAEIDRLDALDTMRDTQLVLTCNYGNSVDCMRLMGEANRAVISYQTAQYNYETKEQYLASLGVNFAGMVGEYLEIDQLREEVSRQIYSREGQELSATLNAFGIGAAGGAIAAGGYVIAIEAIPAALGCFSYPVCFNQMGIAVAEAAAGDAFAGTTLVPAISVAAGALILRKGDQIIGAIDQATGLAKSGVDLTAMTRQVEVASMFKPGAAEVITIDGQIFRHNGSSGGAKMFEGASEAQIMRYFEDLTGQPLPQSPTTIVPGRGEIYTLVTPAGSFNLRNFDSSQTGAQWTIDVPKRIIGTGVRGVEELKFK